MTDPDRPAVSVIIPAYNQADYLSEAVQSVLDQTWQSFEVLVIDDGSTDNTAEVAKSYSDPRVRYIFQENRGLPGARNTGIRASKGEYLSYLDSDDCFLPEKLTLLLAAIEEQPELGFVAGQAIPVDEEGCPVGRIFDTGLPARPADWLLGNPLHVGSVLVRRSWQETVGPFDESLRSYEDWDMWIRLARAGCPMGWSAKPVSLYRFHTAQMTRDGSQMTAATFAVLNKVLADPALPAEWRSLKNKSMSNGYLRGAAQAYLAQDFPRAKEFLSNAIQHDPALLDADGQELASRFASWTELPKITDPAAYLGSIYSNLPSGLDALEAQRRKILGEANLGQAFLNFKQGHLKQTRQAIFRALQFNPVSVLNRGVISIFIRSLLLRRRS